MIPALRFLRNRLHASAQDLSDRGHREAAQALWAVVDDLDELLIHLTRRRR